LEYPETSGVSAIKPDKWFLLGEYYFYDKNYQKAKECYERSIETEFKSKEIYENLIIIAVQLNDNRLETLYRNELKNVIGAKS